MMRMQSLVAAGLALPLYCNNNKLLWNLHLIYNSQYLGCAVPVDVRQSDGDGVIRLHLQLPHLLLVDGERGEVVPDTEERRVR